MNNYNNYKGHTMINKEELISLDQAYIDTVTIKNITDKQILEVLLETLKGSPELADKVDRWYHLFIDRLDFRDKLTAQEKATAEKYVTDIISILKNGITLPYITTSSKKTKIITGKLAEYFLQHNQLLICTRAGSESSYLYLYANGVYIPTSRIELQSKIAQLIINPVAELPEAFKGISDELLPETVFSNHYSNGTSFYKSADSVETVRSIVDFIDQKHRIELQELNQNTDIINLKNGILRFDKSGNYKFEKHSADIYSTIQLDIEYKEEHKTECSYFDKYIDDLLMPEDQQTLLEYMAFCISNISSRSVKKALFILGEKDSGKSVIFNVIRMLLGEKNCFTLDLQNIDRRFATSVCVGKRFGGNSEHNDKTITNGLNTFKAMTSADNIAIENKGKDGFDTRYHGALMYCCNYLPLFTGNKDTAIYERMLPLKTKGGITKSKQIKGLEDYIYQEREAIFYKLLPYLQQFIRNNYEFTISEKSIQILDEYKTINSTVKQWFEERCTIKDSEHRALSKDAYKNYTKWCEDNNEIPETKTNWRREICDILKLPQNKIFEHSREGTRCCFCVSNPL